MELVCNLGGSVSPNQDALDYYKTAARSAAKIAEIVEEFAPNHFAVIKSFTCTVSLFGLGEGGKDWQLGPVFTIYLEAGLTTAEIELDWQVIGRNIRTPTADEVALEFAMKHFRDGDYVPYKNSRLSQAIYQLENEASASMLTQRGILNSLKE